MPPTVAFSPGSPVAAARRRGADGYRRMMGNGGSGGAPVSPVRRSRRGQPRGSSTAVGLLSGGDSDRREPATAAAGACLLDSHIRGTTAALVPAPLRQRRRSSKRAVAARATDGQRHWQRPALVSLVPAATLPCLAAAAQQRKSGGGEGDQRETALAAAGACLFGACGDGGNGGNSRC